jgi:hypothetical protein
MFVSFLNNYHILLHKYASSFCRLFLTDKLVLTGGNGYNSCILSLGEEAGFFYSPCTSLFIFLPHKKTGTELGTRLFSLSLYIRRPSVLAKH